MKKIVIIGGGAAGFFAAVSCAETGIPAHITILEKNRQLLSKVRISGGGRCNVTHSCFEPSRLTQNYPRGHQALRGPFSRFQPKDTIAWFQEKGIELKTEEDGRMFPVTDQSETIIRCFLQEAAKHKIEICTETETLAINRNPEGGFELELSRGGNLHGDRLLFASGSQPKSHQLLQNLGHTITPPVPSLFTFNISDPRIEGLSGLSVAKARVSIAGTDLEQTGPLLITHWGVSGPGILKLSAWGARLLNRMNYKADLLIDWLPESSQEEVLSKLKENKRNSPKKTLHSESPFYLPKNLWKRLLSAAHIEESRLYAQLSNGEIEQLLGQLFRGRFAMDGKSTYKEEFVTCGGIDLNEVDFRTMESRVCPGLYFAGEVLDVDGVTGGFNFQNAWTTGWIAAQNISK